MRFLREPTLSVSFDGIVGTFGGAITYNVAAFYRPIWFVAVAWNMYLFKVHAKCHPTPLS